MIPDVSCCRHRTGWNDAAPPLRGSRAQASIVMNHYIESNTASHIGSFYFSRNAMTATGAVSTGLNEKDNAYSISES